jgi:hypothetical protein
MSLLLAPKPFAFATLGFAERNASLFALGYKEALSLGIAQDAILGDLFPESPEQALG